MAWHPHLAPSDESDGRLASAAIGPDAERQPVSGSKLPDYYKALLGAHGPQHWWPGRTRFEIIVGAILTQNTAWVNVERAISSLRREKALSLTAMEQLPDARLAELIRPAGYFRQKAKTLKAFLQFVGNEYGGSLAKMFRAPTAALRERLLQVRGIGPETADSILLYAGGHTVFVVDAYARRILERHGLAHPKHTYEHLREFFEQHMPKDVPLYNEFHALIVRTGKEHCRKREPRCAECPLRTFLPNGAPLSL